MEKLKPPSPVYVYKKQVPENWQLDLNLWIEYIREARQIPKNWKLKWISKLKNISQVRQVPNRRPSSPTSTLEGLRDPRTMSPEQVICPSIKLDLLFNRDIFKCNMSKGS